jgi:hypothetical protein
LIQLVGFMVSIPVLNESCGMRFSYFMHYKITSVYGCH